MAGAMAGMRLSEGRTPPGDCDLYVAHGVAVEAAEAAGALVRGRLFRDLGVHDKGTRGDVVTDLDLASEKLILTRIQQKFPGHRIISEEVGSSDGDCSWTWLVDPLDGTNNVVIGLPVLAVGITLCHEGVPVVSAVHDPVSGRTWSAIRGQGAQDAGGRLLRTIGAETKRRPSLAWIQGYSVDRDDRTAQALKLVLSYGAHRLLDLWAPLTCWMMLVRGDIDGIVGYRIGEIDLHSGALIAAEAGLAVHDFSGAPFVSEYWGTNDGRCLFAGSPTLVGDLVRTVPLARRLEARLDGLGMPGVFDG